MFKMWKRNILIVTGVVIFIVIYLIWWETSSVGGAERRLERSIQEYNKIVKEKEELEQQLEEIN